MPAGAAAGLTVDQLEVGERLVQAVRAEHLNHPLDVADPSAATDRLESLRDYLDIAEGRALGDVTTLRDPTVNAQLQERVKELQAQEA